MVGAAVDGSSSPSTLGASDSFAATLRADDDSEISDKVSMDLAESPELSEGESEDESDNSGDNSSGSSSSGDGHDTAGRSRVRARGRSLQARGRGTMPSVRGRRRRTVRGRGARGDRGARGRGAGRRPRGRGGKCVQGRGHGAGDEIDMIKWKKEESNALYYNYHNTPGPTGSDVTAIELFSRFFTAEVWDLLVQETNRYASENVSHTPHARPWEDATVLEMKAFVGILILMGVVKLPRLEMYWQVKHPLIATEGISWIISRIRSKQID